MLRVLTISTLLLLFATDPAVPAAPDLDPVIADVVRMLEAGVEPGLVAEWLDRSALRPGTPGPDDLIALTRVKAPEELVRKIMDLAAKSAPPVAPVAPRPSAPLPGPVPEVAGTVSGPEAPVGEVTVEFRIDYEPEMVEYQMTPWDLFVYLDGRPLAWADGWTSHTALHKEKLVFRKRLDAGRHVIRILQEQHTLKSRRNDVWRHVARVYTRPVTLDLDREGDWRVEMRIREKGSLLGSTRVPVEYTVLLDGKALAENPRSSPSGSAWSFLCEEVRTAYTGRKEGSKAARKALEDCVAWDSLWEGAEGIPDRDTVRRQLEEVDFRPAPAGL